MEKLQVKQENSETYFKTYEVKKDDLESIEAGANTLVESGLFENGVLDEIRMVTYDSNNLYIFTKGTHISIEKYKVEEIPSSSKNGFKIFKIKHSGFIGNDKEDYQGARAWLLCDEIESTALDSKKFPNENILYEPDISQPNEILDVVSMAPKEPFEKLNTGRYDYLTDVLFHEVGHIEHRRLENWQEGQEPVSVFPSPEQEAEFKDLIRKSKIFSTQILDLVIESITKGAIGEMYPMLIDREASRRYKPERLETEDQEFKDILSKLNSEEGALSVENLVRSKHATGRILVRILEEQFPEFLERKNFVRKMLTRHVQSIQ